MRTKDEIEQEIEDLERRYKGIFDGRVNTEDADEIRNGVELCRRLRIKINTLKWVLGLNK